MCGRYSLTTPIEGVQRVFRFVERPNLPPRYNIAPTQEVPVVRLGEDGARHLVFLRWGLIPFWADDPAIGSRLINARAESAADKPAFRAAFARRRCLIAADGFYEWRKPARKGERKQPYRVTLGDGRPFAFAGLWERWGGREDEDAVESCTILTTEANALVRRLHDRMPVILPPEAFDAWLDPASGKDAARDLLGPYPADDMVATPVSPRVNNVANDEPAVIEPVGPPERLDAAAEDAQGRLL